MKTIETQKAELLDKFYRKEVSEFEMRLLYSDIVSAPPLSSNPYIDEVMSGRLLNIIIDYRMSPHD